MMTIPYNEEIFIIEATRLTKTINTLIRLYGTTREPWMHHRLTTLRGELKSAINFMFEERTAHVKTTNDKNALMYEELSHAAQKHARNQVIEKHKDIKPRSPKIATLCQIYGYNPKGEIVGELFNNAEKVKEECK